MSLSQGHNKPRPPRPPLLLESAETDRGLESIPKFQLPRSQPITIPTSLVLALDNTDPQTTSTFWKYLKLPSTALRQGQSLFFFFLNS